MESISWSADEAFHRAPAAMAVVDAANGTVLRINEALAKRLGVDSLHGLAGERRAGSGASAVVEGATWPSPLGGNRHDFAAILDALGSDDTAVLEHWLGDRIDPVWWRQTITRIDPDHGVPYLIIQVEDRSQDHRTRLELTRAADFDELTGLVNRRRFRKDLHAALSAEGDEMVGLLLFDVDAFKAVNDTYGHAMGDAALSAVGASLRAAAPKRSMVARLSGDEFAVLLRAESKDLVADRCARLVATTSRVVVGENAPEIRLSAGWAVAEPGPDADRRVHDLMIEADVAMYANKARVRAERSGLFGPDPDEPPVAELWPPGGVVRESGFELWAHPVVMADGGQSALHDITLRGTKSPVTLGALVRMLEMIERHSSRVVGQPAQYLLHLQDFPLGVGSAVKWLGRTAADVGLEPGSVTFALPEARLLDDGRAALPVLASLRDEGLGLAIDGFGARVGSLRLLADLCPNQVWFDHRLLVPASPDLPASGLDVIEVAVTMVQRIGGVTGIVGIDGSQVDLARSLGIDLVLVPDSTALRPVGVVALEGSLQISVEADRPPAATSTTGS